MMITHFISEKKYSRRLGREIKYNYIRRYWMDERMRFYDSLKDKNTPRSYLFNSNELVNYHLSELNKKYI